MTSLLQQAPSIISVTGTWTPVLTFATPGDLSVTYSTQVGYYIQAGKLVVASFNIVTSAFTFTTASGNLNVTGLPVTPATLSSYQAFGAVTWRGITKANFTDVAAAVGSNSTTITFSISGSGQAAATVAAADMPTGGTVILRSTVSYTAA